MKIFSSVTPLNVMVTRALDAAAKAAPPSCSPDIIDRLIAQSQPRPESETACRESLKKYIAVINNVKEIFDVYSPRKVKAKLVQFHSALRKVVILGAGLGPAAHGLIFPVVFEDDDDDDDDDLDHEKFDRYLNYIIRAIEIRIPEIRDRKGAHRSSELDDRILAIRDRRGARPKRISQLVAAAYARSLIAKFSPDPPTLTKGGRFFRVASLLFEAATGERADLTRYCRGF